MLTIKELKQPKNLVRIRFSQTKQKIAQEWDARRHVNQKGYIDLEDEEQILTFYNEIKPLLFQGFSEDFPDEPMTPRNMKIYLAQNLIAFEFMNDKKTSNIWTDLWKCFMTLWEENRLEMDEDGILK
jgi:hypothetical protein